SRTVVPGRRRPSMAAAAAAEAGCRKVAVTPATHKVPRRLLLRVASVACGVHLVWLCGPLSGLIVQPLVGHLSDHCASPLGRRRPYVAGWFPFILFDTDWMGQEMCKGNPNEGKNYQTGVRMGAPGLMKWGAGLTWGIANIFMYLWFLAMLIISSLAKNVEYPEDGLPPYGVVIAALVIFTVLGYFFFCRSHTIPYAMISACIEPLGLGQGGIGHGHFKSGNCDTSGTHILGKRAIGPIIWGCQFTSLCCRRTCSFCERTCGNYWSPSVPYCRTKGSKDFEHIIGNSRNWFFFFSEPT
ncbi:unnamed protein product, partial [Musa banksii]